MAGSQGPTGWAPKAPTMPRSDDPIAEHFRLQEIARKGHVADLNAACKVAEPPSKVEDEPPPEEILSPGAIPKKANKADTDVFDILGIPKSDDYKKAEQRKHDMLTKSAQKFCDVLIQRKKPVIQAKGKFGAQWNKAFMRRASAPEVNAPVVPAGPWEQFEMTQDDSNYHVDEVIRFKRPTPAAAERKGASASLGAQCFALRWNTDARVATAYFDGTIQIHDVGSKKAVHEVNMTRLRQYEMVRAGSMDADKLAEAPKLDAMSMALMVAPAVTNLRWLPTSDPARAPSSVLASVDTNGTLTCWQVNDSSMSLLAHTTDEDNELYGVDFCSGGTDIVAAGKNRYVSVFDAQTLELKAQLKGRRADGDSEFMTHTNRVVSIKAHPNERDIFVSAGLDRAVKVWDLRVGEPVINIGGPSMSGDCLDFSANGDWLLTASGRSADQLELWDWRNSQRMYFCDFGGPLDLYRQCSVTCAAFSKDPASQFIFAAGQANSYARVFASPRQGDPSAQDSLPSGVVLPGSPSRQGSLDADERSATMPGRMIDNSMGAKGPTSPSGRELLVGEKGLLRTVSTWTGSEVSYRCVEGSPSGQLAAFGLTDGTVLVSTTEKKKSKVMSRRGTIGFNA